MGLPPHISLAGIALETILPAPITAPLPIVAPFNIVTFTPINTLS